MSKKPGTSRFFRFFIFDEFFWHKMDLFVFCSVHSVFKSIMRTECSMQNIVGIAPVKDNGLQILFLSAHILLVSLKLFFKWTNLRSLQTSVQKRKRSWELNMKLSTQHKACPQRGPISVKLYFLNTRLIEFKRDRNRVHFKAQNFRLVHNRRLYLQFNQPRS